MSRCSGIIVLVVAILGILLQSMKYRTTTWIKRKSIKINKLRIMLPNESSTILTADFHQFKKRLVKLHEIEQAPNTSLE